MTTIVLSASDQLLSVVSKPKIASGDMNSVLLRVEFDSIWDRFTKSAVFFTANNEEETYEMILSDNECTIPHEVLEEAGILNIGIRGVDSDTNAVKTSTLVKYRIEEGAPSGSGTTEEPTPTVYHQILALSEETRDIVAESEQKIQDLNYAAGSWTPTIANATFDGLVVEGRFTKVGSTVHLWCTLSADFYGKGEYLDIGGFYPNCGVPSVPWLSSGIMNSNASAGNDGVDNGVRLTDDGNQYYLRISNPVTRPTEGVCTIFVSADYATTSVLDQSEGGAVSSVNGKTGAVVLGASDVGAVPKTGGVFTGDVKAQIGNDYVRLTQGGLEFNNTESDNGFYIYSVGDNWDEPLAEFIGSATDAPVRLTNIATPKLNSDAATKRYVDKAVGNGGGLNETSSALLINILRNAVYSTDQSANITALEDAFAESGDEPDVPDVPDDPDEPVVTLTSISATYSGGDVAVGTALTDLTGIVVTAHYSDGTTAEVTGYTLTGEIAEGSNNITVKYGVKTTVFTVTGIAQPSMTYSVQNFVLDGTNYIDTGIAPFAEDRDWTIACKFRYDSHGNRAYLFAATTNSWGHTDGIGAKIPDNACWFGSATGGQWCGTLTAQQVVRCVFTHTVGGGMTYNAQVINANGSNGKSYNGVTGDGTTVATTTENLVVGINKPNNTYLTGEIYDFQLLDTVWDDAAISAYLANE